MIWTLPSSDLLTVWLFLTCTSEFPFHLQSSGEAEPWDSVNRKKDKKAPTSAQATKESFSGRGDPRGPRGGRGGRGGPGRGGAVRGRGGPRGGAANGRSPRLGSPAPTDGYPLASVETKETFDVVDSATVPAVPESNGHQNGHTPSSGWTDSDATTAPAPSAWGSSSTGRGTDTDVNGSTATSHAPTNKVVSKPATSKLSWAQITRYVCVNPNASFS